MGRTVPTFRKVLEGEIKRWSDYRKALRREERKSFDRLMNACRQHASASGHSKKPEPMEPMIMSILLEHEKRLESIESKIDRILKRLEG